MLLPMLAVRLAVTGQLDTSVCSHLIVPVISAGQELPDVCPYVLQFAVRKFRHHNAPFWWM